MFNVSHYRLAKKLHTTKKLLENQNIKLFNFILVNSKRTPFSVRLLLSYKHRSLLPGLKNVCSLTGKYKSTFNSMRVSRHVYRDLGGTSMLPNFSKLSWACLNIQN